MKITVIGTGYVGLVTGTCLAETGNSVTCVDIDEAKVEMMRNGNVPIYEPHLDVLFERNIREGRLKFTTKLEDAIEGVKIFFLALPTPPGEDGSADLSYVLGAGAHLGKQFLSGNNSTPTKKKLAIKLNESQFYISLADNLSFSKTNVLVISCL